LSVIGCGYLGAVHAAALASWGHRVLGVDTDQDKVDSLAAGRAPFFEPGLDALLRAGREASRLRFTTSLRDAGGARIHFLCVGTPQMADSLEADLSSLDEAAAALAPHLRPGDVVVGKSTVPVGTARRLAHVFEARGAELVWNPEFLREGHAVQDTLRPDRLVYGAGDPGGVTPGVETLDSVYRPALEAGAPRLVMSYESAELVKCSANSYLALRLSFINGISDLADSAGADVAAIAAALRLDPRIGALFLNPGLGFGGGCLPKDLRALTAQAARLDAPLTAALLADADSINRARPASVAALAARALGGSLLGRRLAVLGLSFKPLSYDVRNSQAVHVAEALAAAGAVVTATDPQAVESARAAIPSLRYAPGVQQAVAEAELILLATEWDEYRRLDPSKVARWTRARVVVDARLALDAEAWARAGWTVLAPGRPAIGPQPTA
jgi:UDPglucose 6-dehydrogenase